MCGEGDDAQITQAKNETPQHSGKQHLRE